MRCSKNTPRCWGKSFDVVETLKELFKSSSPVDIAKERWHCCTDPVLKCCSVWSMSSTAAATRVSCCCHRRKQLEMRVKPQMEQSSSFSRVKEEFLFCYVCLCLLSHHPLLEVAQVHTVPLSLPLSLSCWHRGEQQQVTWEEPQKGIWSCVLVKIKKRILTEKQAKTPHWRRKQPPLQW